MIKDNSGEFWKRIRKVGVGSQRVKNIPMNVVAESGDICRDRQVVMETWTSIYADLSYRAVTHITVLEDFGVRTAT